MPVMDVKKGQAEDFSLFLFLGEIRKRVFLSLGVIILCTIPSMIYWRKLVDLIMLSPLKNLDPKPELILTAPHEALILSLKVGIICGFLFSAPILAFNFWSLIAKKISIGRFKIGLLVIVSSLLLVSGLGFSYFLLPIMLQFLTSFGAGNMEAYYTINAYMSFILRISIASGIVFQLPTVSYVLTRAGAINHNQLIRYGRFAVVAAFLFGALLTPPDVVSQVFMAGPLLVLYVVSIGVSFIFREKSL